VALNQARLPETKEATIAAYREALHAHGIDTSAWWDRQLALCTVAMATAFAWEKALGDQTELSWWDDATRAATGHLA
jgi:hypothetical protein